MTVDYEPAPRPAPLWLLPLTIALLALALLWVVEHFSEREVGGFGGPAQPETPQPMALVDGRPLPEVPGPLSDRFGDDIVLAERLTSLPTKVDRSCRRAFSSDDDPARRRLANVLDGSDLRAAHVGPDALTALHIAVDDTPPGYPREIEIGCVAVASADGWRMPRRPLVDFALDGRPGPSLRAQGGPLHPRDESSDVRTRLVQVPVGSQWAVQPRGGWWLAYDVTDTSWVLMTLNDAVSAQDPLRAVFVDGTGELVADRGVGPTRSAAQQDHSADFELVAGGVREILDKVERSPHRVCEPGNRNLCVWLSLNDLGEILAHAAFGPHPLDTPPMGRVGYCAKARELQGTVTSARFGTDGAWLAGPVDRGLDRYAVRFEAGTVVVDLAEHVTGDRASGDPTEEGVTCTFSGTKARGKPVR